MGKKDILGARREKGPINMADVIQNEKLRREIRVPDGRIRNMTLIMKGGRR